MKLLKHVDFLAALLLFLRSLFHLYQGNGSEALMALIAATVLLRSGIQQLQLENHQKQIDFILSQI
jgi:hypothetical protein